MIGFAKYSLLVLLLVQLIWRGIIPAFRTVDTDFPNYYVSSRLALEGRFDRVYDDLWFQDQIRFEGISGPGKFSPYPPVTAFIMMPLAWLQPLNALQAWTAINIGVFFGLTVLLSKATNKEWLWSALMLLLSGHAIVNNFRFGQLYLILSLLIVWSLSHWQRKRDSASGVLMGIGAAVKYFPMIFLPLGLFRKEWKFAISLLATVLGVILLSIAVLGIEPHKRFLEAALVPHLSGNIQNRFIMTFQSWNSLLARLMIFDSTLNPAPPFPFQTGYSIGLIAVYISITAVVISGLRATSQIPGSKALNLEFALISIGGIVLFPASATYHFLLLTLPVSLLLTSGEKEWSIEQKCILVFYVCIGWIPYGMLSQFDGRGVLTLLAYPRLFLTTMLLLAAWLFVRRLKNMTSDTQPEVQSS